MSPRFSKTSEANASELLENREEMLVSHEQINVYYTFRDITVHKGLICM